MKYPTGHARYRRPQACGEGGGGRRAIDGAGLIEIQRNVEFEGMAGGFLPLRHGRLHPHVCCPQCLCG